MYKRVGKPVIFILVIVIAAMTYLCAAGVSYYNADIKKTIIAGVNDIRFGIDINGGVDVTFTAPKGINVTSDKMKAMVQRLTVRMDSLNIKDKDIYPDYNNHRITIRFPWQADAKVKDAETAIKELGATAQLNFRDPTGKVILTGDDVVSATADTDPESGGYKVDLVFNSAGSAKFAAATTKYVGQVIKIYMDKTFIEGPEIKEAITGGKCYINDTANPMTAAYAQALAAKINAGALPFPLVTDNYSTISATMGQNALFVTVLAGIIAFILICLFMILYYRLPGLIACIALCGHLAGTLLCISIPHMTLTLPGIAGIILSIGMGVDCNIITAERIKEELRVGKTLDGAIDAGFERSFSAIFDGNITVIIVGFLLYFLGSGTVQSFGYTLIIGVIFNFIMGLTFSRLMLKSISKYPGVRKIWLFGGDAK